MVNYLVIRAKDNRECIYSPQVTADLAHISLDFLEACEREELIRAGRMPGGGKGYTAADIRNLARIRRLREDLDLDLATLSVVLHMRQRMVEMLGEMAELEQRMYRRERLLQRKLRKIQQNLVDVGDWE